MSNIPESVEIVKDGEGIQVGHHDDLDIKSAATEIVPSGTSEDVVAGNDNKSLAAFLTKYFPGSGIGPKEAWASVYGGERSIGDVFASAFKQRYLYDVEGRQWMQFSPETGYSAAKCGEHMEDLGKIAGIYEAMLTLTDNEAVQKLIRSQIAKINNHNTAANILKFAANKLAYSGPWDDAAACRYMFPFQNGVVDLRTGLFRKYQRTDHYKIKAAICYDPAADCPLFKAGLLDAMQGDEEMCRYIQASWGYMFCRIVLEEVIYYYCGEGGNFKGTVIEGMQAMAGALGVSLPVTKFLKQVNPPNPDAPSASTMALRGAAFCVLGEPDEGKIAAVGDLKLNSGGNKLSARSPYGKTLVHFDPTFTIVFEANATLHAPADDGGFWRRMRLQEFNVKYVDDPDPKEPLQHKRDSTLKTRIKTTETAGLANWVIEGAQIYLAGRDGTGEHPGLVTPQKVLDATATYRREEDTMQDFIDECLEMGVPVEKQKSSPDDNYHCDTIFNHYRKWAFARGYSASAHKAPMGGKTFGRKFRKKTKLATARDNKGNYYPGVIVRDPEQFDDLNV